MAIDYITNYILVKANIGEMPKVVLYNDKYTDELTSDEVYRDLLDKSVEVKVPIDMHLEGITSDENGEVTVTVMGNGDGPPKITKEDMDAIRDKIKLSLIQAIASDPDKVPKSIKRLVDEFTNPKMDWRTMLDCHIKSSVKEDFTFNVPSRRSHSSGCIMPSQIYNETIDIAIAIDTSGSISEKMLKDFLNEVKGIMDMYTDFKIWIWCFDTNVHNPVLFNQYNINDIFSYEIGGGGGTLFEANWDFMKNTSNFDLEVEEIMPSRLIVFTDGYPGNTWGDENYVDTLFIIHGNDKIKAPFGMTAYYDENA
jgi:predicted metal-dependent peptidase